MCGRFAWKANSKKLAKKFKVKFPDNTLFELDAKYNIAPSNRNPVFRVPAKGEQPIMEAFKWVAVVVNNLFKMAQSQILIKKKPVPQLRETGFCLSTIT